MNDPAHQKPDPPTAADLAARYGSGDDHPPPSPEMVDTGSGAMLRAGSSFVAAIIGGAVFGFGVDHVWPFRPFGLLVGFLAGAGLGFYHLYRLSSHPPSPKTIATKNPAD